MNEPNQPQLDMSAAEQEARDKVLKDVAKKLRRGEKEPDDLERLLSRFQLASICVDGRMKEVVLASGGFIADRKAFVQLASKLFESELRGMDREELLMILSVQSAVMLYESMK